jgi:hypothetical protein
MIQSLDEQGSGLRAVFYKPRLSPDRFGHVIAVVNYDERGKEHARNLILSMEGDFNDWPISPPLQSLAIENRQAGDVALLVGMAGQNHWSASVEAIPGQKRLTFDLACRVSMESAARLTSTYLASFPATPRPNQIELATDSAEENKIVIRHENSLSPIISSSGITSAITLHVAGGLKNPIRWRYEVRLESDLPDVPR